MLTPHTTLCARYHKEHFLAVGRVCKATFRPTQGAKELRQIKALNGADHKLRGLGISPHGLHLDD